MQTFRAEGVLETRRGSILVRNREALQNRACRCNESVKNHFEEVLRGFIPARWPIVAEAGPVWRENQLTNRPTNHCFLAISDYIAAQRVRFARSLRPGFLFRRPAPS
jgi:hypothetical protein